MKNRSKNVISVVDTSSRVQTTSIHVITYTLDIYQHVVHVDKLLQTNCTRLCVIKILRERGERERERDKERESERERD